MKNKWSFTNENHGFLVLVVCSNDEKSSQHNLYAFGSFHATRQTCVLKTLIQNLAVSFSPFQLPNSVCTLHIHFSILNFTITKEKENWKCGDIMLSFNDDE